MDLRYEDWVLRVRHAETGSEILVYALREGDRLDMETSSEPFHHCCRDAGITIRRDVGGSLNTEEFYVDDSRVWNQIAYWIGHPGFEVEANDLTQRRELAV